MITPKQKEKIDRINEGMIMSRKCLECLEIVQNSVQNVWKYVHKTHRISRGLTENFSTDIVETLYQYVYASVCK